MSDNETERFESAAPGPVEDAPPKRLKSTYVAVGAAAVAAVLGVSVWLMLGSGSATDEATPGSSVAGTAAAGPTTTGKSTSDSSLMLPTASGSNASGNPKNPFAGAPNVQAPSAGNSGIASLSAGSIPVGTLPVPSTSSVSSGTGSGSYPAIVSLFSIDRSQKATFSVNDKKESLVSPGVAMDGVTFVKTTDVNGTTCGVFRLSSDTLTKTVCPGNTINLR